MKAHIQQAIWPLTVTAAFFGLALIEYPLGKLRKRLSFIYAIVAIIIQVGMYVVRPIWLATGRNFSMKTVADFTLSSCNIIVLTSICLNQWHGKRYHKCLERFNHVDETLRNLGIETDYSRLRRKVLIFLVTWVIICSLLNAFICMRFGKDYPHKYYILLILFALMPLHIRMLVYGQFWLALRYASLRFDCINCALRNLVSDDNDHANWFRNSEIISARRLFVPDETAKRIIWTATHLHFQLCKILRDINTVFETQMCLQMGFACLFILSQIIYTFRLILSHSKGNKFIRAVSLWFWALPYLAEVIVTNRLCETVAVKARTVCDMASRLLHFVDDEKMREDISLMILQGKLRPLRFSCLGFCHFGYDFMYKIFNAVVTIAVIILQLKMEEKK